MKCCERYVKPLRELSYYDITLYYYYIIIAIIIDITKLKLKNVSTSAQNFSLYYHYEHC